MIPTTIPATALPELPPDDPLAVAIRKKSNNNKKSIPLTDHILQVP